VAVSLSERARLIWCRKRTPKEGNALMVSSSGVAGMRRSSQSESVVAEQVIGCWFRSADQARIFPLHRERIRTFGRPGARIESSIWPDSIRNRKGCDSPSRKRMEFDGESRRLEAVES